MVEAEAQLMPELRYASECPDQEMFPDLSASLSPKNLLPTVICCSPDGEQSAPPTSTLDAAKVPF